MSIDEIENYETPQYDFVQLTKSHSDLKPFFNVISNKLELTSESINLLTKYILADEFNIKINLLPHHLCPIIPSRVQYLQIIKSVLLECGLIIKDERIKGLDVGTGPYAIYALLAHKIFNWEMICTDIDEESISNCEKIIRSNGLDRFITIKKSEFYGQEINEKFQFSLSNPPFYESKEEMDRGYEFKPYKIQVKGTNSELIYGNGGEVGFIKKLIDNSIDFKDKIIWFSSLIGKKSTVGIIIGYLKHKFLKNFFIKDYQIGNTKRWIVFWSYQNYRAIVNKSFFKDILITSINIKLNIIKIETILKTFTPYLNYHRDDDGDSLYITCYNQCWTRQFKRRLKFENKIACLESEKSIFIVTPDLIRWKFGSSYKTFQSFYAFLQKNYKE
ncbi:hypothetical protein WICMUC_004365 [Wickerhamomyces mucosus]|uniref:U6 small nuclear RNA (adenine-(43)-N(6))-methyltransferase n=1 Tax=Wickerhamomyces mucosus TaxID=1378264 RepID=A0A9P8PIJ5_9ASCO|nr:hypothetical protein WICMUC_004365 [Wickerhamomyces mucosus]